MVKIIYPSYYGKSASGQKPVSPRGTNAGYSEEGEGVYRSPASDRYPVIYVDPPQPSSRRKTVSAAGREISRRRPQKKKKHRLALAVVTAANLVVGATLAHLVLSPKTPQGFITMSYHDHGQGDQEARGSRAFVYHPSREAIEEAQRILAQPVSQEELKAKPYVDRVLNNSNLQQTIIDVSHINHSDPVSMIQVIAAETSAQPDQFGQNKKSTARTAMQITSDQFVRLLGTYGKEYADNMRRYASGVPDHAADIVASANELEFVAQFVRYKEDMVNFEVRDDLYNAYMRQANPGQRIVPLRQRIDALWTTDIVSLGMQDLSDERDEHTIQAELVRDTHLSLDAIFQRLGSKVYTRGSNYMGKARFLKMCEMILKGQGHKPVVGNLMDAKTAARNFSPYQDHIVEKRIKKAGHIKIVPVRVSVTPRTETVEMKWQQQISKWDGIYRGIRVNLERLRAQRIVAYNRNGLSAGPAS